MLGHEREKAGRDLLKTLLSSDREKRESVTGRTRQIVTTADRDFVGGGSREEVRKRKSLSV